MNLFDRIIGPSGLAEGSGGIKHQLRRLQATQHSDLAANDDAYNRARVKARAGAKRALKTDPTPPPPRHYPEIGW